MVTLCSVDDVLDEVGVGASSDITLSSAWVTRFIEKVEGIIVSETRRDWVDSYADVDADVKKLLKDCCAVGAAKKIVAYDRRGFASRLDAETKIDILHDDYIRTLKALKDLDTTKIRGVN